MTGAGDSQPPEGRPALLLTAGQEVQLVLPVASWYCPPGQLVQPLWPVNGFFRPTGQSEQLPAAAAE